MSLMSEPSLLPKVAHRLAQIALQSVKVAHWDYEVLACDPISSYESARKIIFRDSVTAKILEFGLAN